jgi:hypothetical protein
MFATKNYDEAKKVARETGDPVWKCPDGFYLVSGDEEAVAEQDEDATEIE